MDSNIEVSTSTDYSKEIEAALNWRHPRCLWVMRNDSIKVRIKRLWNRLTCNHKKTCRYYAHVDSSEWTKEGRPKGPFPTAVIEGCLDCGAVTCFDFAE